jgi:arylsulfatase A-like enzyme
MRAVTRILVAALFIAIASCARDARPPRPHALVIITLDTTRADRLPMYGFGSVSTPALDRIAAEGVILNRAMTVAPLTLTAHTSLFTGLYPPHHGVRDNADRGLDADRPTLATVMHAAGFKTGAFVAATVLAADRGLARGFDLYDDGSAPGSPPPRRRSGDKVVDAALGWLDTVGASPFFMWVHLYDAHSPQRLPIEYRRTYGDSYVGGIAFADAQIGRLLDALARKHLLDTTTIVVAGDHGESLGEHGEVEHGIFLYEGVLHVPLFVRTPGLAPTRVSSLVSLVDVAPTVLELFRLQPAHVDGVSLLQVLEGGPQPDRRGVYAESMYAKRFGWSPLRALLDDRFKYIDAPRPELYDLQNDPFETNDLSGVRLATAVSMRGQLDAVGGNEAQTVGAPASADVRERLASLGYTTGALAPSSGDAPDPKDTIQTYNAARQRGQR